MQKSFEYLKKNINKIRFLLLLIIMVGLYFSRYLVEKYMYNDDYRYLYFGVIWIIKICFILFFISIIINIVNIFNNVEPNHSNNDEKEE